MKKYRYKNRLFIVEGVKIANELLFQECFNIKEIFATENWINETKIPLEHKRKIVNISNLQLKKISSLKTPNKVIALVEIPNKDKKSLCDIQNLHICLEDVRDPGNLGTIIRIADWYGLKKIYCSKNSVDCFNTKVIQSAMGSVFRINVNYVELDQLFEANKQLKVYGTFMNGTAIKKVKWEKPSFLLMGNEANGISYDLSGFVTEKVSIPLIGNAESLNLSVATGIFVNEILG